MKLPETNRSRRTLPFHPPLFAAFPILSIYSANLALIPLSDLWVPFGAALGVSLLVWLICTLAILPFRIGLAGAISRGASAAALLCGTLILYGPVSARFHWFESPWVWFGFAVLLAAALAKWLPNPYPMNLVGSFLTIASIGGIAWGEVGARMDLRAMEYKTPVATLASSGRTPDIFYIILDGYGREDMLNRVMQFDNSAFVDALKSRGFYVADRSHSNYMQTEISLSSSLNGSFIPDLLPNMPTRSHDRSPFDALISKNAVARFLRNQGYRTIAVTSGFPPLKFPGADLWLTSASTTTLFETTLLQMTPLVDQDKSTESMFTWRRKALLGALENVRNIAAESARPRFVFVHILAPHPPFVFGPHGEMVAHHGPFGYWDASDFMQYVGTPRDYRNGYVHQMEYLNSQVLKTLDALLASKRRPVILVQGDHGSKMRLEQNDLAKTDVTECFQNLSAYYVPDSVRAKLYPSVTPVNSFRIILSTLFGANMPNLPDRSWYSPFAEPLNFTEVTGRIEVRPASQRSVVR